MCMRVILMLANHKCIAWMPASEEEKPTARQQLPNHSLVWTETMAVTAVHLSTLCSGFPLPAPHSRRRLLPRGPRGLGRQSLSTPLFRPPPRPSLESQGQDESALSFGEGLPVPSHSYPQIQRRRETQGYMQLPPRSQRPSQRGRVRKKKKEAQVPGWLYLLPSSVFLSSFCFTVPSPKE